MNAMHAWGRSYRPAPEKFHQERLKSGSIEDGHDEEATVHERADHWGFAGTGGRREDGGFGSQIRGFADSRDAGPHQRQRALVVPQKANEVASFHRATVLALAEMVVAPGLCIGLDETSRRLQSVPGLGRSRQAPSSRRSETQASSNPVDSLQLGSASCPTTVGRGQGTTGGHLRVGRVSTAGPRAATLMSARTWIAPKQKPRRLSSLGSKASRPASVTVGDHATSKADSRFASMKAELLHG